MADELHTQVVGLTQQLAAQSAKIGELIALNEAEPLLSAALDDPDPELRLEALYELCELLSAEDMTPAEGANLGRRLREEGSVECLAQLLDDDVPEIVTHALWCLGNICSDSVDTLSRKTKRMLLRERESAQSCPSSIATRVHRPVARAPAVAHGSRPPLLIRVPPPPHAGPAGSALRV